MMTLAANKQGMFYSLQGSKVPIYETDEDGNIIYDEVTGEPIETGDYTTGYSDPIPFFANINNKLNEVVWQDYGIDNSTNYAQIVVSKGKLPLKAGSVIWKKSEVCYKDDDKTIVDETTADYIVKGVADEGMSEDLFLLQRNVK
jgi:hypothetical protein